MARIVQITDSHVTAEGTLWKGQLDTGDRLKQVVQSVNTLAPDLVIHTGDVVENGASAKGPSEYVHAAGILEGLNAPLLVLPGNHDGRANMRRAFSDQPWVSEGNLSFEQDFNGLRIVGVDTLKEGQTAGEVSADQLHWLSSVLGSGPSLVFQHHPPCPLGLPFMDGFGFEGFEGYAGAIHGTGVLRIACGHVHTDAETSFAGTTVAAAEATSAGIPPDMPAHGMMPRGKERAAGIDPLRIRFFDWKDGTLTTKTIPAACSRDRVTL